MLAIYFSRKPCLQALIEIRAELGILNEGVWDFYIYAWQTTSWLSLELHFFYRHVSVIGMELDTNKEYCITIDKAFQNKKQRTQPLIKARQIELNILLSTRLLMRVVISASKMNYQNVNLNSRRNLRDWEKKIQKHCVTTILQLTTNAQYPHCWIYRRLNYLVERDL